MAIRNIRDTAAEHETEANARPQPQAERGSFRSLFSELTTELSTLVRKEIELAKAETSEKAASAKNGLISMASGGALAFAGVFVLLMAAVYGLSEVMHPALGALIVGAAAALIGYALIKIGSNKLDANALTPERTARTLREDRDFAKERFSNGQR